MSITTLSGLPAFSAYFVAGLLMCAAFIFAYTRLTPNDELHLIRSGNIAAAIAVGLSLIGFSFPLASAIYYAGNLIDSLIWAAVGLIAQLTAYLLARLIYRTLPQAIANNDIAAGIFAGSMSIAAGLINAACMSV